MAAAARIATLTLSCCSNPKDVSFRSQSLTTTCFRTNLHVFKGLSFSLGRDVTHLSQPICAVNSELNVPVTDLKNIGTTLKKAKVVIETRDENTIKVRVDLTGKDTQKVFDDVLANLARTAPAVPGFRRQKGGKTSNVPKEFLIRAIGESRIIKFVIQEIISTSMTEYVEEEGLKVKKEFKTIQTPEELESLFEPGNDFGFNATLEVDKSEGESESETTIASSTDV